MREIARGSGGRLETPVVFLIHKRPDTTEKVFQEIARARPRQLFVVADGPAPGNAREARRCAESREIVRAISWDCEVLRNYADMRLGLKRRISSGLDWAFSQVEEAIILEDDCAPHPDFFRFCENLLSHFRDDPRIMMISGNNFQERARPCTATYYFSRIAHIWGWATWRRAWQCYDVGMTAFPRFVSERRIDSILPDTAMQAHYLDLLRGTYDDQIDNWGYRWQFAVWNRGGLVATPNSNLVSNIGFGPDATHTPTPHPLFANRPTYPLDVIEHANDVRADDDADLREFRTEQEWYHRPLARRVCDRLIRTMRRAARR
jgi:hypothetical protein